MDCPEYDLKLLTTHIQLLSDIEPTGSFFLAET